MVVAHYTSVTVSPCKKKTPGAQPPSYCAGGHLRSIMARMGRFEDLVAQAQNYDPNSGEEGLPASIYDDLTAEYIAISEGSASKVAELQAQLQNRESEISRLKSANYDLLMSSGADSQDSTRDDSQSDQGSQGIDDLFTHR